MKKYRRYLIFLGVPILIILFFGLTYLPQKIVNIKPEQVSRIIIFDGGTGYETEITDRESIHHIINNLNTITFHKDKLALFYMGFSYRTTIFNDQGKPIKKLTINSPDTIRYKGFFYKTRGYQIDYEYIKELVAHLPKKEQ